MYRLVITVLTSIIFSAASGQESFRYPVNLPVSFGVRQYNYPYNSTRHTGADYLGKFGDPILAAASGEIVYKENMSSGDHGMGYNMIIKHLMRDGSVRYSFYGHMNTLVPLNVGDMVYKGQQIGTMGNSGYGCSNYWNCKGCSCNTYDWAHLHFELKSGTLNPASATANSCNPYNGNNYWGYTPNHPDNYCYEDPSVYVAANSAKFTSTPVPSAPNNVSNVSIPVVFSWSSVPNAVYRLQVYKITNASPSWSAKNGFSTSTACSSQLVVNVNIQSGNSFTWNSLISGQVCALPEPNTEYRWTIRSYINGAGTSPFSFPVGFVTGSSNSLTVSPSSRSVAAASGNTTFAVTSVGVSWTATDNASWLTVSPTGLSGSGTLTATYSANTSTSSRTATITITGGGITQNVTVTQAGANSLTVSPSSRSVAAASGNTTFAVTSVGVSWTATDNASWLTVSPTGLSGSGTLTATYSANTSTSSRTATITITGGGITQTMTVTQAGANSLTVSPSSRSVAAASGNTTFAVTSVGVSWTATDNASWLTVSPTGLSGSGTLTATYSANTSTSSRTATITITGGGITQTVTVTQAGATVSSPANDNPCGAISLPVVSSWTYTTGTNINATTTTNPGPTSTCTFYGYDVWYSFIASASVMTVQMAQTGTATDMMMALYSGSCGSLSGLTCDDDSGPESMPKIVRSGLTIGVRYYIRVWGYNGQIGTFGIAVRAGSNFTGEGFSDSPLIARLSPNGSTDHVKERMSVYPNPTYGRITITTSSEGGMVRIVNLFGQTQKSVLIKSSRIELDLNDLAPGLYFVHYAKGNWIETAKFELIH